jgi:dihydroorotase
MYDLLLKSGRVIDPANNIDEKLDIAVSGDKIVLVKKDIEPQESQRVIDVRDKIVAPGLIDFHCHVFDVYKNGVKPDIAGVQQGVTTVVDAGTAGKEIFNGFPKYIIPSSTTSIFTFINIRSAGLTVPRELSDWSEIDPDATSAVIEAYPEIIKGIKIRIRGTAIAESHTKILVIAKETARKFGLPVMVHVGEKTEEQASTAMLTEEVLPLLDKGDVLSHIYTANRGGVVLPDGSIMSELKDAMKRGILLDIAHGHGNFSFRVAKILISQGILPTTISTDLGASSVSGPVYGLTVMMSKLLAVGLDIKQLLEMTTINPARVLGIEDRKGSLKPGMDADISILELQNGLWELQDSEKKILKATKLLVPSLTIKSGQVVPVQIIAQPPRLG